MTDISSKSLIQLSKKAVKFMEKNKLSPIYKAAWLDSCGKEPTSPDTKTWVKFRAWFKDGSQITIDSEDQKALIDSGISPIWISDSSEYRDNDE